MSSKVRVWPLNTEKWGGDDTQIFQTRKIENNSDDMIQVVNLTISLGYTEI